MMKKLLVILLCLFAFITPIFAEPTADEDGESTDQNSSGYSYGGDKTTDESGYLNYWPTENICQLELNQNNKDSREAAIIREIKSTVTVDDVDTGNGEITTEFSMYYFNIGSNYFGTYGKVDDAIKECTNVYDAINGIIDMVHEDSDHDGYIDDTSFTFKPIKGKEQTLRLNWECEGELCTMQTMDISKEEALKKFFQILGSSETGKKAKEALPKNKPTKLQSLETYYEDIIQKSILAENFNPVFNIDLTDGEVLSFDKDAVDNRTEINDLILNGTTNQYSAYQRFGPNISFVPYFGERGFNIEFLDRLYSAYTQDKLGTLSGIKDVLEDSSVQLSTMAYQGRAYVLPDNSSNRLYDPRVSAYAFTTSVNTATDAALGNFYLSIAKFIVAVINSFLTDEILRATMNLIEKIQKSSLWSTLIVPLIYTSVAIGVAALIVSLVKHARNYARGKEDIKPFLGRFFGNFLIIGIIYLLAVNPTAVNFVPNTIMKFATDINEMLLLRQSTVNQPFNDDVVNTSVPDGSTISASTWRVAIFNPWCRGMFQTDYDNLFTHYAVDRSGAPLDDYYKIDQTYQNIEEIEEQYYHNADKDGKISYDSAGMTGDVGVPLGDGYESKNWAIFAWSTQSIYHIDSNKARYIIVDDEGNEQQREYVSWPNAQTTPGNSDIYADTFRWLDAKLNISPGYANGRTKIYNYPEANKYKQTFVEEGINAIKLSCMLLILIPTIFVKYKSYLLLSILSIQIVIYGIINLFKENNFTKLFPKYVKTTKDFLMANIKLIILVNLYYRIAGKSTLNNFIFLALAVIVQIATIERAEAAALSAYSFFKNGSQNKKTGQKAKFSFVQNMEDSETYVIYDISEIADILKNAISIMNKPIYAKDGLKITRNWETQKPSSAKVVAEYILSKLNLQSRGTGEEKTVTFKQTSASDEEKSAVNARQARIEGNMNKIKNAVAELQKMDISYVTSKCENTKDGNPINLWQDGDNIYLYVKYVETEEAEDKEKEDAKDAKDDKKDEN